MLEFIYQNGFLFFIFGFFGWVTEVAFAAVKTRRFVNRGFNMGPICPIYGVGLVVVWLLLKSFRRRWILLFLLSVVITSAIELVTGFFLDKIFHNKWWDYSGEKYNLGGYICLRFSIIWGILCMVAVKVFLPVADKFVSILPRPLGWGLLILFSLMLFFDFLMTLVRIRGFNEALGALAKAANELHESLHDGSDAIGTTVFRSTIKLSEKYDALSEKTLNGFAHFLDAFPTMRSEHYNEELLRLRARVAKMRENNEERIARGKAKTELARLEIEKEAAEAEVQTDAAPTENEKSGNDQ